MRGKFSQGRLCSLPRPNIVVTRMLTGDLFAVASLFVFSVLLWLNEFVKWTACVYSCSNDLHISQNDEMMSVVWNQLDTYCSGVFSEPCLLLSRSLRWKRQGTILPYIQCWLNRVDRHSSLPGLIRRCSKWVCRRGGQDGRSRERRTQTISPQPRQTRRQTFSSDLRSQTLSLSSM